MKNKPFNENEHPRDSDGKFTAKSKGKSQEGPPLPPVEPPHHQKTFNNVTDLVNHNTPVEDSKPDYLKSSYWGEDKLKEQEVIDDASFTKKIERKRTPESDALATKHIEIAHAKEHVITEDVVNICTKHGGDMAGLEHRLKGVASLSGKIYSEWLKDSEKNPDEPLRKYAENIIDNVRYTSVVQNSEITAHVDKVLSDFESKGYRIVKCKNTFKKEAQYKGVNCNLVTPDGYTFELQFHTPESMNAKEQLVKRDGKWTKATSNEFLSKYASHKYYEELRAGAVGERKKYLDYKLISMWEKVENPSELDTVCQKYTKE